MMSSVADLVEAAAGGVMSRVRDRFADARVHELADTAVHELVRSLRTGTTSLPTFQLAIATDTVRRMLRELSAQVLDAIEARIAANDLRRIAEWFAAATERALGDTIHARKQAEGRLRLLSKIGLLAESSELDSMLARAAGLAIPELADWSIFELVHEGEILRSTVVHPDGEQAARTERQLLESRVTGSGHLGGIELGGKIYRLGTGDADGLAERDPALCAVLQRYDAETAIVVPFFVMGTPIAVATFVFCQESGRRHDASDLDIAGEIARRAAQIVENARLQSEVAYRERVMGILGHDLRNPIAAVLSISKTLERRVELPERTREGLGHIHRSAQRMEQMIASILDFTQVRFRGVPSLSLELFDLEALAGAIVDELRVANPERTITIEARGELGGRWDVTRIGQVISNLVGNALSHGARDSPVVVSLTTDDERVLIAVTNRGPTIPAGAVGKLFEPFWQGAPLGTGRSRGLGLGLFIAQQVVLAHGGEISVRSQNDQTTFSVRLPR